LLIVQERTAACFPTTRGLALRPHSVFFTGPEKYDFNLYKGFFVEKMTQIRQILKFFVFCFFPSPPIRQIFMISSSR
jgi:hypothetical protein